MQCSVSVFVLCLCVCVHACVCVCTCVHVCVRVCAVQTASSANALWKTNSVSVDGVSRQRSSSDPPAVHPPLPPLRVTSTSTFFPFSFLASGLCRSGWLGGAFGSHVGRGLPSRTPTGRHCLAGAVWRSVALPQPQPEALQPPPSQLQTPVCPAPSPRGAHSLSPSVFPSISATFLPFTH